MKLDLDKVYVYKMSVDEALKLIEEGLIGKEFILALDETQSTVFTNEREVEYLVIKVTQ